MQSLNQDSNNINKAEKWVLTLSCPDKPGIVNAISGVIVSAGGNITESHQFSSSDTGTFFMRIELENIDSEKNFVEKLTNAVNRFGISWNLDVVGRKLRTLILASKAEHCVNDLLFRQRNNQLPIEIPKILANHNILAKTANFYGIDFEHIAIQSPSDKEKFENRVREVIKQEQIELVVLARYMQILSPELCEELEGMAINIHHSFLPGFKGANPYRQAHQRGVKLIGATAHFVTTDLDEGPIIEQDVVRVDHSLSPKDLVALGQDEESRTLRRAVLWFAQRRILLDGDRTIVFK